MDIHCSVINQKNEEEISEVNEWIRFGLRLAVSTALHPFEYSKVLVQLGYEPIRPRTSMSIFGKPILVLPSMFQYTCYIRSMDGFYGCYRGFAPKMMGSICSMVFSQQMVDYMGLAPIDENKEKSKPLTEHERYKQELMRNIVLSVSGVVVAHPFHVISVRMMAEFIGRETIYSSIVASIKEIYTHEGIFGFFSGVMPKIVSDVLCIVLTNTTVYIINKHIIKSNVGRQYNAGLTQFAFSNLLYPLQVVATCMTVSGSRLLVASSPLMPKCQTWMHCLNDLGKRGELHRGSSILWRTISPNSQLATQFSDNFSMSMIEKNQ